MKIWLNGDILDEVEALLPVWDRGVLFGDGLFETIRAYGGMPFRLDRHLSRMRRGCEAMRFGSPPPEKVIGEAIGQLYRLNVERGDAYIRITMTGGPHDGGKTLRRPGPANLFIMVEPYEGYDEEIYERGMRLVTASSRRNSTSPLCRIKSNNYLESLFAKQEAREKGADEALFLNEKGEVAEAASANIFWINNGEAYTPDEACGLLPGITREAVLELCGELDIGCRTVRAPLQTLLQAEEAFITVSTAEIVPIAKVDGIPIGNGVPGVLTRRLAAAYRELVEKETAASRDGLAG